MASTQDTSETSSASRNRRRVSRVNYAEDNSIDETLTDGSLVHSELLPPTTDLLDNSSKDLLSKVPSGFIKPDLAATIKRDRDALLEKVPLNWQPTVSPKIAMLAMLDFNGAIMVSDSTQTHLHLADGTVFSPEGNDISLLYFDYVVTNAF